MKDKLLTVTVSLAGVLVAILIMILGVKFFFGDTIDDILQKNETISGEQLENMVKDNLQSVIGEPLVQSELQIDTSNFDSNEAGQKIYNGQVIMDGILASDIPTGTWEDGQFFNNQIQRVARKIYLMKPYNELMPPTANTNSDTLDLQLSLKEKMNIWIESPQYIDKDYNDQMFTDEVTTALKTFLCVYMNLWDLSEITIVENDNVDAFQGFDIDYTFDVQIYENYNYLVGVKTETNSDGIQLHMLYITN